jgi:hypothetical protein
MNEAPKTTLATTLAGDVMAVAAAALHAAVNILPEPASGAHVNFLASVILHTARIGERDVTVLQALALERLRSSPDR